MSTLTSPPIASAVKATATRTVSATEARVHFGEMLRAVNEAGEDVIIERSGKPEVALISIADYEELRKIRQEAKASAWGNRVRKLRQEIASEWQGPPLGDVDEMIERGQR